MVKEETDRLSTLRRELRRRIGETRYELWFGDKTQLQIKANILRVLASSSAEMQWLGRNFGADLRALCASVVGPAATVEFDVSTELRCITPDVSSASAQQADTSLKQPQLLQPDVQPAQANAPVTKPTTARKLRTGDKPKRMSFETFFSGDENQLALHTAEEVARNPGRYSPLLLSGPSGCGKTHLLTAIGHGIRQHGRRCMALTLTAEQFTCQFLESLDRRALPSFRQKVRSADILLVDDVQFLSGKRATLEELINTIDSLQQREGQVVLTSDCSAGELSIFSAELHSRVSGGLAIELQPPDYTSRLEIVRDIAQRLNVDLRESVDRMIAQQAIGSARLLSGAINRLVAASMAKKKPIDGKLAEPVLAEFARQNTPQVRLADIQRAVCNVFGVEASSLKSPNRTRRTCEPRMLAMWLARRYTRAALSEIGDFFGGRSHSTVVSANRKFESLIGANAQLTVADSHCTAEDAVRRVEKALRTA